MKSIRNPWISISLYHNQIGRIIHDVALPLKKELEEKELISNFIFNRSWDRGENLIIMCEISDRSKTEKIKQIAKERSSFFFQQNPAPEKAIELPVNYWFLPYPNNHFQFNSNFILFDIMETGGLYPSMLAQDLLAKSSDIVLDYIKEEQQDLDVDSSVGLALQLQLILLLAFDKNIEYIHFFYQDFFSNILTVTDGGPDPDEFQKALRAGLENSFEEQKDSLVGFTHYIVSTVLEGEEFEDERLNDWFRCCTTIAEEIETLQSKGHFIPPEDFQYNSELFAPRQVQEKWLVFEYYLRAINSQLGLFNIYEINVIYCLKECCRILSADMMQLNVDN